MPGRILVVDDLLPNVKLLEAKLTGEYYDVITASNGFDALKLAQTEAPDIILLDIMMPEIDGFEVCARLKADPRTTHIPVVMVTALSDPRDKVRGLEAGADEFLSKPVRDLPLFARVRSLVRLKILMDAWRVREETSTELGFTQQRQPISDMDLRGCSIALLASEPSLARQIQQHLDKDEHVVELFDTIDAYKHALQKGNHDLALASLYVHGKDTLHACSQLRSHEKTRNLPILLVADENDEALLVKALEIGLNDYIVRPLDAYELRARVRTQIRRLRYQQGLRNSFEQSISLALTDELTKLYNRRYFNSHIDSLLNQAGEQHKSIALLMVDIDHFKKINDTYGHDEGDKVLQDVAKRLSQVVRDCDLLARLGGEEFVVVMPDARVGIGLQVAERLRQSIESDPFILLSGGHLNVTISVGLGCTRGEAGYTRMDLLKAADEALYKAKHSGRNRVVVGNLVQKTAVAS